MDKQEIQELLKLKKLIKNDQDDRIFQHIFQSLFLAIIFGIFVMLLWNALLPDLFKLPQIDYLQSVGLIILARLIFGGVFFQYGHKKSKTSQIPNNKLLSLSRLENISDWKYYDKFWEEEGEQTFNDYKKRMESDNSSDADNLTD